MAREWNLQETKALVENHIALKEEKPEVRTASEHWNKVSNRLREKGFNRSYRSCNKRWYRLEQYAAQIFSFNVVEGKQKNYWDMSRAERLEFRDKWPQLPSGDGIDKEMIESLKKFSHQCEKENYKTSAACTVQNKEAGIRVEPSQVELNRQSAPSAVDLALKPTGLSSSPMVTSAALKQLQDNYPNSEKQFKISTWPAPCTEQQPLSSSQEAQMDGFQLQARELKRRRAAEQRRNNRTVPYNSTLATFIKPNQPTSQPNPKNSPPLNSETTTFGSITVMPPPDLTSKDVQPGESPAKIARASHVTHTKPPILFKRVNSHRNSPNSYKPDTNQAPQNNNNINGSTHLPAPPQQRPIGSHLNFQSSQNSKSNNQQEQHATCQGSTGHFPWLQHSIKSSHQIISKNGADPLKDDNLSLEEQLQVTLGVHHGPLQTTQTCEEQVKTNVNESHLTASLLGAAIGRVEGQLGAIAKLIRDTNASEEEFRDKMLLFVEWMVESLHTIAHANACNSF
ncbi:hypothetical protein M758_3G140100 [Ceratodon purpureus]|nr:hypothetical protein M758_3G140100 [Ceratodon purpureus]